VSWVRLRGGIKCGACSKSDWCLVSDDGRSFLCMRVESKLPFALKDGSVGYIHRAGEHRVKPIEVKREVRRPTEDIQTLYYDALKDTQPAWQEALARKLGVTFTSIKAIGAAWSKKNQAWMFPMRDGHKQLVGIRLRSMTGEKWAVTGSKNALFIPEDDYKGSTLFLFEGPTDTCSGVSLGLRCIGRPSCSAGLFDITTFVKREAVREVVVVADNDKPGLDGAEVLKRHLPVKSVTMTLPVKDMREFLKTGGSGTLLESMVKSMVWTMPCSS